MRWRGQRSASPSSIWPRSSRRCCSITIGARELFLSTRHPMLRMRALGIALLTLVITPCAPSAPKCESSDVTGSSFARDFALTDHNGNPRALADFRGKGVVVFFGYTQCPDVCPTTLTALAEAMKELGPDADRVQVLFVTVDPERDSADLLSKYVPAFDRRFLGLRGDADATARTAKEFKILYQKQPGKAPGS